MTTATQKREFVALRADLRSDDPWANYWMRQATLRLRREVGWCWQERGLQSGQGPATLPPFSDKASTALDMSRFWTEKQHFYLSDPTAKYLTEQLNSRPAPANKGAATRGSFGWVVRELELDDVATFVLALSLVVAFDGSMGSVVATCLNDQAKTLPSLALAQRLWDQPEEVLRLADPFHPLFRYGLAAYSPSSSSYAEIPWEAPIVVPSLVARQLLSPESSLPQALVPLNPGDIDDKLAENARLATLRLSATGANHLRLIPVMGAKGSSRREIVAAIARLNGKEVVEFQGAASVLDNAHYLNSIATVCWLRDNYLFFSSEMPASHGDKHLPDRFGLPSQTIPTNLFLAVRGHEQLAQLPVNIVLPTVHVPPTDYQERLDAWRHNLGRQARSLETTITECARRFRFEKETIRAVCEGLKKSPEGITPADLVAGCRAELGSDLGELAGRVVPRFRGEELILPHKQHLQFQAIVKAMESLTEVHYVWGTGKVWNEGGISVLFAGPPGTGKTMAAEILALKLDLPMYRIDLSQVVNKYIGETEKNLKHVFDTADQSDMILFFDEADSLFGRRTEVSDAHDRYANLEISYLLERMERFKGLAILATNRKKDLDEAFLRRLRYIIDFPLPDVKERKRIWQQVMPEHADSSQLDFSFLAERFPLAGGNIRSIVFNACLQCADGSTVRAQDRARRLTMEEVITAIKREYDKVNRRLSPQQYGAFASLVEGLEIE